MVAHTAIVMEFSLAGCGPATQDASPCLVHIICLALHDFHFKDWGRGEALQKGVPYPSAMEYSRRIKRMCNRGSV